MATLLTLLAASCASLYAQLKDEKTLDAVVGKAEAFRDQPPLMQANAAAVAVLCFALALKVREKPQALTVAAFRQPRASVACCCLTLRCTCFFVALVFAGGVCWRFFLVRVSFKNFAVFYLHISYHTTHGCCTRRVHSRLQQQQQQQ